MPLLAASPLIDVDPFIQAYETARERNGRASVGDHLPPGTHPGYPIVLAELVRVDLEYSWAEDRPRTLEKYLVEFPDLRHDVALLTEVAFEEFRQRLEHGQQPNAVEYARLYGIDVSDWQDANDSPREAEPASPSELHATRVIEHTPAPVAEIPACPVDTPPPRGALDASSVRCLDEGADAARIYRQFHDAASVSDSLALPNVPAEAAHFLAEFKASNPAAAARFTEALATFPEVGTQFADFHLLEVLGRGAFGCVYLARQGTLADRLVALKVAPNLTGEQQTLARLQHTNIVPVYSYHTVGAHQVVCMPYFGSVTLADVIGGLDQKTIPGTGKHFVSTIHNHAHKHSSRSVSRSLSPFTTPNSTLPESPEVPRSSAPHEFLAKLTRYSYVEAVLWLGARLADGLGHAHERGIIHRDLKPANILLTDEGQPMLLDFNLAADDQCRTPNAAARIGGTLPYMAPEHLAAFKGEKQIVDARSDVYSLGLLLFELLVGRQPFAARTGPIHVMVSQMIEQRMKGPPRLIYLNPAISPSTEAIILKCLHPDPSKRYATARNLQEDLDRHLNHQPLLHAKEPSIRERGQKWARRNPRLTSMSSVAAVAAVFILALTGAVSSLWERHKDNAAAKQWAEVRRDVREQQVALGIGTAYRETLGPAIESSRATLERYNVLSDPKWETRSAVTRLTEAEQRDLKQEIAELLFLTAEATALQADAGRTVDVGQKAEAIRLSEQAAATWPETDRPAGFEQLRSRLSGSEIAPTSPPRTPREKYLAAADLVARRKFDEALPLVQQAIASEPDFLQARFLLGHCMLNKTQTTNAIAAYDTCTALAPDFAWAYFMRGLARSWQKEYAAARVDFTTAITKRAEAKKPDDIACFYSDRAFASLSLREYQTAVDDFDQALKKGDPRARVYFRRGWAQAQLGNTKAAAADIRIGMQLIPTNYQDWYERGLARFDSDPAGALTDFDRALELNPTSSQVVLNKFLVLSKKLWRTDDAIRVLDGVAGELPASSPLRTGRALMHARHGEREKAIESLNECRLEKASPRACYLAASAYAVLAKDDAAMADHAIKYLGSALAEGCGANEVEADSDFDAIRKDPRFESLIQKKVSIRLAMIGNEK